MGRHRGHPAVSEGILGSCEGTGGTVRMPNIPYEQSGKRRSTLRIELKPSSGTSKHSLAERTGRQAFSIPG